MRAAPFALALMLAACSDAASRGRAAYQAQNCRLCHTMGSDGGGGDGPDLAYVGMRRRPEWLRAWLQDPKALKPSTLMPRPDLDAAAREDLVAFLSAQKGAPIPHGADGKGVFRALGCAACHGEAGRGGDVPGDHRKPESVAPALRLRGRYDAPGLKARLLRRKEGMPSAPLSSTLKPGELDALVSYLLTLG